MASPLSGVVFASSRIGKQLGPNPAVNTDAHRRGFARARGRRLPYSLGLMVTVRTWVAIVGAPILGAGVYAWLTLASLAQATVVEKPTPLSLVVSGAVVGLLFELVVLVPLLLALRRWWRLDVVRFAVLGCLAWFLVCFLLMLPLGHGASDASATAVLMFLPGAALVLAFWFLGANRNGA